MSVIIYSWVIDGYLEDSAGYQRRQRTGDVGAPAAGSIVLCARAVAYRRGLAAEGDRLLHLDGVRGGEAHEQNKAGSLDAYHTRSDVHIEG